MGPQATSAPLCGLPGTGSVEGGGREAAPTRGQALSGRETLLLFREMMTLGQGGPTKRTAGRLTNRAQETGRGLNHQLNTCPRSNLSKELSERQQRTSS